jgi:hypothetical protein
MKKLDWHKHVQLMILEQTLAQLQHPVASSEALDLLHLAMHMVKYQPIVIAIKTASNVGSFSYLCLFACCPSGRRGNPEQVVAQWRCPEASSVALDMLHWAMCTALHPRPHMAIKMASKGGHLFVIIDFVINHNHSKIT